MTTLNPSDWSYLELFQFFGPKVLLTVICGGLIGLERELKNKPAGIKTNILICLGATVYTSVSMLISLSLAEKGHYGDPARVAAQIVSGIGFLGGGAIVQSRGTIQGLTTAANIWVVAALGIAIGLGYHVVALALALIVVLMLVMVSWFEDKVLGRLLNFSTELVVESADGDVRRDLMKLLSLNDLTLESFDITKNGSDSILTINYTGHRQDQKKFHISLWGTRGVKEVKQVL